MTIVNVLDTPSAAPWGRRDQIRLTTFAGAGLAAIALSWFIAAGRRQPDDQLPLVSLALLGLMVAAHGISSWLTQARRRVQGYRRLLLGAAPVIVAEVPASPVLVARPDGRWFHRSDCLLTKGRDWTPTSLAAHHTAGRRPCPACQPTAAEEATV